LFIAPWLIGFVVLGVLPLAIGLLISFTNYDGLNLANVRFIGLGNYARVVSDPDTGYALSRTLIWSALNVPIWLLFSLSLALLLNRSGRAQGLFRTLFYLPSIIPLVATVWIWRIFLDANSGLLNGLISLFRPGTAVQWFADYGLVSLTAISVWAGLGSGMVIFLAGLQGIPSELEEAARIDGASGWDVLRYITLPLLTPVIFFQLVLALISSFQQIVVPLMWAGPSATVPRSVYLYMVHTYQQIFAYQRFGYGIALVWLLLLVIAALTLLVFRSARYWVHYEEGGEGNSA
jgi:multiple sugar transport system permease protein